MTDEPRTPSPFHWGVTSSSVQTEGVHPAADWSRWERDELAPRSGDGNGMATNFHDDLALIASLGVTDVRVTVEWARIEPLEGKVDSDALDRYDDMISGARAVGLRPWVTLQHTTLPGWFSDDGGSFLDEKARSYQWIRQVDRCAERFGEHVEGWTPIDDPVGWALRGYALGSRPPGRRRDSDIAIATLYEAIEGALIADHLAARLLSSGGGRTMAVRGTPTVFAAVDDERSKLEADAAARHVRWWAAVLFDSWAGMVGDGELALPDRRPLTDEAWTDDFDLVGLAFDHPIALGPNGELRPYPPDAPRADSGFAPLPEELGVLLHRMAERLEGRPLVVAANGLATTNDGWRTEVLGETLDMVAQSLADGVPLIGYFHDTAIDGYEWRAGFETQRGLIARDRTIKDSALLYQDRITTP